MIEDRSYGEPPYRAAVVHGGPGAPGSMAPVARMLARRYGVIEPLQTSSTIMGQVEELARAIEETGDPPVTLIGHSWGAWLCFIVGALYPKMIKELILVGAGSFESKYVLTMRENRDRRLTLNDKQRVEELMDLWKRSHLKRKREIFKEYGAIMTKIETYQPISSENSVLEHQPDLFEQLMEELGPMRERGELLSYGARIESPVLAIHGDWDCTPYQGIDLSLSNVVKDFRFALLERCGHYPWNEVFARDQFFEILFEELKRG